MREEVKYYKLCNNNTKNIWLQSIQKNDHEIEDSNFIKTA